MRPLLVSIALLLLALCRQSTGVEWTINTVNSQTSSSTTSFISKEKKDAVLKSMNDGAKEKAPESETSEQLKNEIFGLLGNTLFLSALEASGNTLDRLPELEKALANGILCEVGEPETEKKVNKIVYGSEVISGDAQKKEKSSAAERGFDCDKDAPVGTSPTQQKAFKFVHKCWCTDGKTMTHCQFAALMENMKVRFPLSARKTCRPQAVAALKEAGNKVLGALYTSDKFGKDSFEDAFKGNVDAFSVDTMKGLLCDAIDPSVEAAVKAVYASDALYWLTETVLYSIIFGEPAESLSEICAQAEYKTKFGECVCKQDTGYTFCIYKVIAQAFSDAGYLTCGAAPTFDNTKKPSALPQLAHKSKGGASGDKDEKSTTASPASPTTSSAFSLLPPAAAAAAMLLLLRQ